jgi:hypothetical protein
MLLGTVEHKSAIGMIPTRQKEEVGLLYELTKNK